MNRTALLLSVLCAGCVSHISPYKAKHRRYDHGDYAAAPRASGSSLYVEGGRGLFEDLRASGVGDVIVVHIDEADQGSHSATAKLEKTGESNFALPASLGLMAKLTAAVPGIDAAQLLAHSSASSHDGKGAVERKGRLVATLPVRVREVLPNGDFFVEGSKVVMVNQEEHHLYLSGVVRAADVRPDNSVLSSQIADAEIEYTGRGDVSDQQRPGWLSRIVGSLWPF